MNAPTYPFPLAVNSSHHSSYHRFLLGASSEVLAPFPRPHCLGELAAELSELTDPLTLATWRKLYHASVPWVPGFEPAHYRVGTVPPHRPLPPDYGRPTRKFAAYDLVQIADPSVSALALVAGDRRVLADFLDLNREQCARVEAHTAAYRAGPSGSRVTGRCLLGRFAEPNNRWLMPFLHVHARVLNFTAFREAPREWLCLDPSALALGSRRAAEGGRERQAERLRALGYAAEVPRDPWDGIQVRGVSPTLLATMAAPRTALLRLLERLMGSQGGPERAAHGTEREAAVIAAMADRLESIVAHSLSLYRPPKVALPFEGPWRTAVDGHLRGVCPADLAALHGAAGAARSKRGGDAVEGSERGAAWTAFPVPASDRGHQHRPDPAAFDARDQLGEDCELNEDLSAPGRLPAPSLWLVRHYEDELAAVRREIAAGVGQRPDARWRRASARLDALTTGPEVADLLAAERDLDAGIGRHARQFPDEIAQAARLERRVAPALASLDELFERSRIAGGLAVRERGGLSR